MTGGCSRGDIMEDWELGTLFWILVWGIVFVFVLSIVDLQCCVSFCSTAQGIRYMCACIYMYTQTHTQVLCPYRSLHSIEEFPVLYLVLKLLVHSPKTF